jgi:DNA-binding NarL/FixJ family response regulator
MLGLIPPTTPRGEAHPHGDDPHLLRWEQAAGGSRTLTAGLSRSELDVLEDAANGLTTKQSAAKRSKSTETVKSQRTSVLAKLGARNMVQAVAMTIGERAVDRDPTGPIRFASDPPGN